MTERTAADESNDVSLRVDHLHVASIGIHRPPNNFFDAQLIAEVVRACERAYAEQARVVVLFSEGKHFCAGMLFEADSPAEADTELYENAVALFTQPLPVIAAIQGAAIGGGLGLALAADLRVATPAARFSANFARLGFHHGFGLSVTLPAVVGERRALDMLYTGRRVSGPEAYEMGLCDRLVAPEQLMTEAYSYATEIAESAPLAVQAIRDTMRGDLAGRVREALEREKAKQDRLMQTADWREGVAAVNERRPARFTGR